MGDAARRAADAAGDVDEQRMFGVDLAARLGQLPRQAVRGGGVAEEQQLGLLVVDEVAARRGQRLRPAGGDGLGVVAGVLDNAHAALAQAVFLPFLASADMCTTASKPSAAAMTPMLMPRLPVLPTVTAYWPNSARACGVASRRRSASAWGSRPCSSAMDSARASTS